MTEHSEPDSTVTPGDEVPHPDNEPAAMPTEVQEPPTEVKVEAAEPPAVHDTTAEEAVAVTPEESAAVAGNAEAGTLPPPADHYAPPTPDSGPGAAAAVARDRPEFAIGAAFAVGFLIAFILKRLASR